MTQDTAVPQAYPPPAEFAAQANATAALYQEADADRLDFWRRQGERLSWATPFTEVLDWSNAPFAKWFGDGKLNVAYNCLDRHVEAGNGDRVALLWEGEPGDERRITYAELTDEVKRLANVLEGLGVGEGDLLADGLHEHGHLVIHRRVPRATGREVRHLARALRARDSSSRSVMRKKPMTATATASSTCSTTLST